MEINSVATIDDGGARLANFLAYLKITHGVTTFDLVASSMGGLFSRAAIRVIRASNATTTSKFYGMRVASLTTLGTPHEGSFTYDWNAGLITLQQCVDEVGIRCYSLVTPIVSVRDEGAGRDLTTTFLNGPSGWNAAQAGNLDGIAVTLVAGNYYTQRLELFDARPITPNDGHVRVSSALMNTTAVGVLPSDPSLVRRVTLPLVHSLMVADVQCPIFSCWSIALGWSDDVVRTVVETIDRAH